MSYDSQTSTSLINKLRKDVDALVLRIATLQDQKATGVDGGASVANTWTTRTLNAIHSDPYGIITSLSNNEFTVEAGEYQIRVISPFHSTTGTRTRIIRRSSTTSTRWRSRRKLRSSACGCSC